jgi:hypothetical protein
VRGAAPWLRSTLVPATSGRGVGSAVGGGCRLRPPVAPPSLPAALSSALRRPCVPFSLLAQASSPDILKTGELRPVGEIIIILSMP